MTLNQIKFGKAVAKHKKELRNRGYPESTIKSWQYGKRRPLFETAMELSVILGMKLSDIPYYKIEHNS
jgi:hypothetical protein